MAPYNDSQTVNVPLDQGHRSAEPRSLDDPRVIHDVQQYGAALREGRPADRGN